VLTPEVRYTESSGVRIAYQVYGDGPFGIVCAICESIFGNTHASVVSNGVTNTDRPGRPPTSKET